MIKRDVTDVKEEVTTSVTIEVETKNEIAYGKVHTTYAIVKVEFSHPDFSAKYSDEPLAEPYCHIYYGDRYVGLIHPTSPEAEEELEELRRNLTLLTKRERIKFEFSI